VCTSFGGRRKEHVCSFISSDGDGDDDDDEDMEQLTICWIASIARPKYC
jgi:hypothetical protein